MAERGAPVLLQFLFSSLLRDMGRRDGFPPDSLSLDPNIPAAVSLPQPLPSSPLDIQFNFAATLDAAARLCNQRENTCLEPR